MSNFGDSSPRACDAETVDIGDWVSKELLNAANCGRNNCKEPVDHTQNGKSCLDNLISGEGSKLLRILLQLTIKGYSCSNQISELCCILIPSLVSLPPSDFTKYRDSFSSSYIDDISACTNSNAESKGHDIVAFYNNIRRQSIKKNKEGKVVKASWNKRKRKLRHLTGRWYEALSTDQDSSDGGITSARVRKSSLISTLMSSESSSEQLFHPLHKSDSETSKSGNSTRPGIHINPADMEQIETGSEKPFNGPFELATVLLDLLESSFCSMHQRSLHGKSPTSDGYSPMSVAMQLVSAITALQQSKGENCSYNAMENDKLMSQISYEDTRWTPESLSHLQRLVIRTVLVLCHVSLMEGQNLQEMVRSQAIESLMSVSQEILKDGGMVPHGTLPLRRKSLASVDDHLSDQDVKDTEKSTSKSPSVFVDKAHPFTKQFTTRRTSQPTCVINRPEDDCVIPISIVFVAEIIKGLFSLLTGCLKQAPGTVSPKQLTEVIMLLHEFDSSNGFLVFSNLLMQLNSLSDQLYPPTEHQKVPRTLKTCTLSPVHSPTKTNFKARLSPQLHAAVKQVLERDNPVRNLFNDLLGSFEKVIAAVQRSKVEYVHKVTCSRRSHRTCDLHKFVPTHHDILGEEAKLRMKKNSRNAQSKQKRIYPIPPITSNIKGNKLQSHSSREEESSCIVATCIQFLVNIVVNVCPKSPSVRPTLRSLDKVGVCQCQAVTSIVTPLLCHLECWNEKIQNAILAYVGKILLYHLRESSSTQSTETLSSFFINIPNSWLVKAPTSSLFTSNGPPKKGNNWRLSLPINMPSSEPSSTEVSAEESFFIYNLTHPWLCLVMYRKLLASPDPDLSLKVALHLQTISPHLSEESKMALSSLVLVPILCTSSGIKYSLMKRELSSGEIFREEIFSIVLGILLQYLESSDSCRAIFLRHGAIKAVNKILSQSKPSQADEGFSDHIKELVFQLGCTYLTSVTSLSPDVTVALFSYFKKPPLLKQQSTEPDISVSGPVKTFFRGFSWGSEKYRTESRERSTSFGSLRQKQEIKAQLDHDHQLSYTTTSIDELSLYYTELHKFVRIALTLSGAITNDKAKERSRRSKNFSFGRALSGESTDSDPESRPRGRQRNLSETSGYRSTSPESLNRSISNGRSISSRSVNSSIRYVADSVSLPTDDNMATWQQMVNYWHILGLSVPMDNQISTTFIELNGFDVALKLLTLVSSSLNEYYLSEMNFTCATQDITAAGSVLDKSNNSIIESPHSESNLETNHGISITVNEFSDEILPNKTIPLSSSPKDTEIQKESTPTLPHPVIDAASVDNLPDVPDFSDEVLDLKLIEMKLSLFTSCLRICLFCSRKTDQFEIDVDDIISSLRPTLTGKLLSTYFGLQLFSAIFNAAVSLVNKSEDMCPKISTVLQGLQRVVTSGGSATRSRTSTCHSRSNSASIAAKLMEDIDNIADEDDYDSDSDGSTTGGYDGDSEAGALATPLIDVSKYWNDCSQQERLQGYPNTSFLGNDLDFTPGPLLHPELLLLAIELLGNGLNSPNRMRADSDIELLKEKFAANAETLEASDSDVRECLIDAVGRALTRLSGYSKQNLDKMAKTDVAGYCFENFSDVLSSDKLHWKGHRDIIFSLCMILTKYHMTSKHLRLILSLFNSSNPPLEELLVCLHDLVEHQEFGPNFCLSFSWRSSSIKEPTSALPSDSESDLESMSFDEMCPTSPQRSLTVWRVAPLHMQLENHIAWPPMDAGVTISLWLRIGMLNNEDCGCYGNSWTEGHVIMVESVERNQASTQSSPYVHLLSIGSKQTMLQVWMENTTLIFRVCVDPNDGKPVGLLAQTECANFLQPNQWQHLAMTYTESRMPDKAILGKVHLILDCFIETDVILEFNLPQAAPKTGLSSWRQPTPTLNAQKVTFFLGHHDKLNGNFTDPEDNIMTTSNLSIGNIMIFNLGNFSCQSAFAIEQLGADVCCFTECLSDSVKSDAGKESRVRFIKDDSNPKITPERGLSPSPRLFKLLPQTLNSDLIDDEIITGQIRPDFKSLQDALVLSYTPCEPTIFHLHSVAAPVTPTKKRKLFRRAATDTVSMGFESSPLIHCSRKVKVRKAHKEPIVPNVYSGLNRALSQVGGVQVFLLLYPKVIESSTMMREMSSDDREQLQVLALKSLLHLRASDTKRRKEFLVGGIAAMLNKVMTKSECVVGYRTLQELMNTVCSEELVQCHTLANGQLEFRTNPESVGLIHDHEILTTFILDWKIWHKAKNLKGEQDFSVWTLLLQSLESLMRDDHIYQWFNIKALLQGRIVEKLLNGIQEMLNNETTPFPPPHVMISIVSVIRGVIGSPPDVNILSKISDFLIAVHSAAGTFVCHSTTSFYFSLTNRQFPITPRKLSDARFGKFGKSMENLRKVTTPHDENIDLSVPDPFLKKSPKISRTNSEPAAARSFSLNLPSSSYDENDDSADPGTMISSNEENSAEVFEDKPDNLTVHSEATSENQSTRHHLTPIPELDGKSPSRPRTLPITSPDPESDCLIITSDGDITMTAVDEENESGHPTIRMDSWENLPRPNETTTLHNSAIFETNEEEIGPEGLTVLVCELLNVLFISVMTMSDADVPLLFGEALTSEMLVVMLHHPDPEIRTAVLRMLAAFCSRCSSEEQNNFLRKKGFHLVANQLHQHPTTRSIAEACFYFLLGHPVVIDEQLPLPLDGATEHHGPLLPSPDPFSNHAVIVILAILEKSFWQGPDLCYHLVSRLNELFECMGPVADVMLDNGLTLALCNLLSAIGQEDQSHLPQADKQILYDVLEDLMGSVAVKSCVISGSGHFQVFEDLMILLYTVEKKSLKLYGSTSDQVVSIKNLTYNLLLRVLDSMVHSSGGGKTHSLKNWSETSSSKDGADSQDLSPMSPGFNTPPSSPTYSDPVMGKPPIPMSPNYKQHRRVVSLGNDVSSFVPSPSLSRARSHQFANRASYVPNDWKATSGFRPRSGGLRSRSFKGNQRRRINEAETAHRLQRVVVIAANRVVFTNKSTVKDTISYRLKAYGPLHECGKHESQSINQPSSVDLSTQQRTFGQLLYDIIIEWLVVIIESLESHHKRHHVHSQFSLAWERILGIAQQTITHQASRLLTHFLSPKETNLRNRTYPLHIMNHSKIETLLMHLLPPTSKEGMKVTVYLQCLLSFHKLQLDVQNRLDVKKMSKCVYKIGHRISADVRRALHGSVSDVNSTDAIDDLQEKFLHDENRERVDWRTHNSTQYDLLVNRTLRLGEHVSRHAMDVTQLVVLQQNNQRKQLIVRMKDVIANDLTVRKKWTNLLEQLAHERAVWYNPKQYPKSWQLDPTEGPYRERRRLQRCHINIDKRFMLSRSKSPKATPKGKPIAMESVGGKRGKAMNVVHKRPLAFIFEDDSHSTDSVTIRTRLQTNERISTVQTCTNVTSACETTGELLIGENNVYFVGDAAITDPSHTQAIFGEREVLSLSWQQRDIVEYHKRWWQLRDTALEVFLMNGKTYLLAFNTTKERDFIEEELNKLNPPNLFPPDDLPTLTKSWCSGKITNFEYLTKLNKAAGRSFNDLMQYPVMPFVLSDYTSQILDLDNSSVYRKLEKPISVQDSSREQHFKERYKFLEDDYKNCSEDERELKTPPFHYGSHYSNSGTVLHFLVRLPPFTQMFLEYQDSSFDIPDRTFHSMATTYRLSSYASTTDVKELIPEFFFFPEFLCNLEGFDFGLRQCGIRVNHVTLPLWSKEDPRLFVLIHRQALESDYVTAYLHYWIDLVFGYKQLGQAALEAVNVFHPATYFGMDISSVEDPVKRTALETMVKTYGQTPKMLFPTPHPPRSVFGDVTINPPSASTTNGAKTSSGGFNFSGEMLQASIFDTLRGTQDTRTFRRPKNSKVPRPIPSVKGLMWGDYVGSPSAPEPTVFLHKLVNGPIGMLVPLQTNDVCALAPKMGLLVVYTQDKGARTSGTSATAKQIDINWSALVTYNQPDNIIRLKLKHNTPGVNLTRFGPDDTVTCCATAPDSQAIIFGTKSGQIVAHRCNPMPEKSCDLEITPPVTLYCHSSKVTCLSVCGAYRIFVSGSQDGTAVIWDLDALLYVRSLTGHASDVTTLAISNTSGDICTVCDSGNDSGSHIRLWTINGSLVAAQDCKLQVRCVAFSSAPEGTSVNVVAGGLENGTVRLWSSWDLTHVRDVTTQSVHNPIVSVAFSHNSMVLYAATERGFLVGWCRKDKEREKQPLLITFLDSKAPPLT